MDKVRSSPLVVSSFSLSHFLAVSGPLIVDWESLIRSSLFFHRVLILAVSAIAVVWCSGGWVCSFVCGLKVGRVLVFVLVESKWSFCDSITLIDTILHLSCSFLCFEGMGRSEVVVVPDQESPRWDTLGDSSSSYSEGQNLSNVCWSWIVSWITQEQLNQTCSNFVQR